MPADSDIQVWLDTAERVRPGVVVPYVASAQAQELRYRIRAVQEDEGGRSVIGQAGAVQLAENTPAALSRLSLGIRPGAACTIEITLTGKELKTLRYVFECPS